MGTRSKGPNNRRDCEVLGYTYADHPKGESKPARRIRRALRDRYKRALELAFITLRARRAKERLDALRLRVQAG